MNTKSAKQLTTSRSQSTVACKLQAQEHGVTLEFIKPGKPMQNGFTGKFNRSYRQAVLDMYVFRTLDEVREQTETWIKEYNEERSHESLRDLTPREISTNSKTGNLYSRVVLIRGTYNRGAAKTISFRNYLRWTRHNFLRHDYFRVCGPFRRSFVMEEPPPV